MLAGERGIDSPVSWKGICSDGNSGRVSWRWEFQHDEFLSSNLLLSAVQRLDMRAGWKQKLLHFFCFQVNIFFHENILWAVDTGFTGSANMFQEVVKFKACMFLLSLLLSSICFQLFLTVWFMNTLLPTPDRRNNIVKLISAAAYLQSIEFFLLPFRKLFLGSAERKLHAASLLQSRSVTKC